MHLPYSADWCVSRFFELTLCFFGKTCAQIKVKDCQVVQTRISRHHGGNDHKTELQVGAVDEDQLYKVLSST